MGNCCEREQKEIATSDKLVVKTAPDEGEKTVLEAPEPLSIVTRRRKRNPRKLVTIVASEPKTSSPPKAPKHSRSLSSSKTLRRSQTSSYPSTPSLSKASSPVIFPLPTRKLGRAFEDVYFFDPISLQDSYGPLSAIRHKKTNLSRLARIVSKGETLPGGAVEHLFHEVSTLKQIDHPNVLQFTEVLEDDSRYFLLYEPIRECEIVHYSAVAGKLTEMELVNVAMQLIQALNSGHKKGIFHKNVSAKNVVLLRTKTMNILVKITGVGAGKRSAQETDTSKDGILAYFAPEMFSGNFSERGDIWSCGVLIYFLASNTLPFRAATKGDLRYEIEHVAAPFPLTCWGGLSLNLQQLLQLMLKPAIEERATAETCMKHDWLKESASFYTDKNTKHTLKNLRLFRGGGKLKMAMLAFLSANALSSEEKWQVMKAFNAIDANGDSAISQSDLVLAYSESFPAKDAKHLVKNIMDSIDLDKNGFLTCSEFLLTALDEQSLLTDEHLQVSFELLDKNSDGSVQLEELLSVLNCDISDIREEQKRLLSRIDEGSAGEMDFEKFKRVVRLLCSNEVR